MLDYFQMIVRVFGDGLSTDVPVTPETTCSDVIECCRDPGEEPCDLVAVSPELGGKHFYSLIFSRDAPGTRKYPVAPAEYLILY